MVKTSVSTVINSQLNNQNPINLMNISNQKLLVNHVRMPTVPVETNEIFKAMKHVKDLPNVKELLMTTKDDKEINLRDSMSPNIELILQNNESLKKEKGNFTDNKKLTLKTKRRIDIKNNTSVFPFQ